ncbi:MAG: hypothetical protein N3I35_02155 [Clostridia bacterium]|nr:hypothetical protein [Clostridia bacterium]
MKKFEHIWNSEFFLLHIQLNNNTCMPFQATVTREYEGGKPRSEVIDIKREEKSYRFIVSRSHPKEKTVVINYPEGVVLEAFKVDDRAYYPTESFFAG